MYYITSEALMRYYMLATMSGDREVGGWAKWHTDDNGNMIVTALRPLRQQSTSCFFEIDEVANAQFLEELVAEGEDPGEWNMLFHTHPEGMGASMSGVDVDQLDEMARDFPGKIARSMIMSQGKMNPTMHEAVCVDGRVFMRTDCRVTILDYTGAHSDLTKIGFFDPPKKVVSIKKNDGWYDELPSTSAGSDWNVDPRDYDAWLDAHAVLEDAGAEWIGERVMYKGSPVTVIDAYDIDGDVVLVMPDGEEVSLEKATVISDAS